MTLAERIAAARARVQARTDPAAYEAKRTRQLTELDTEFPADAPLATDWPCQYRRGLSK